MTDVLFVYGSLRSECQNPHARFLHEKAVLLGRATVRGSLFRVGEFAGYRQAPDGIVHGEVWRMGNAEAVLAILDDYEGPEYPRIVVPTSMQGLSAWIYTYRGAVRDEDRIESGDLFPA